MDSQIVVCQVTFSDTTFANGLTRANFGCYFYILELELEYRCVLILILREMLSIHFFLYFYIWGKYT